MTEYVLAWLLALERGVLERAAAQAWDGRPERGLAGRRIGIMGTGSIGSAVARGCRALGLAVSGFSASGRALDDFDQCFAASQLEAFSSGLLEFAGQANAAVVTAGMAATPSFNSEVALFTELKGGLLIEASVGAHRYGFAPITPGSKPEGAL